jgi:hypothetical protein
MEGEVTMMIVALPKKSMCPESYVVFSKCVCKLSLVALSD